VVELINRNAAFMRDSDIAKLLISAEPGSMVTGDILRDCRQWRNQTEVSVPGRHFLAEDSPAEIGRAILTFLDRLSA